MHKKIKDQTADWRKIITFESGKRSGQPCIRGMRITVGDVLEYLAGGMSEDEILVDFPYLTRDDIPACLAYAAEVERRTGRSSRRKAVIRFECAEAD